MNIKPSELENRGYQKLAILDQKEMIPFLKTYLYKTTKTMFTYWFLNGLFVALTFIYFFTIGREQYSFLSGFNAISNGVLIAFLLIPVHEAIHMLAYKYLGAPETKMEVQWKSFLFLATAHNYVVDKNEFTIVAFAPISVLTVITILVFLFLPVTWWPVGLGILMTHTALCSGDFSLVSFFDFNKDKEIVTYDDQNSKISYFYCKK